jgi:hypothetical protein
MRRMMIAYDTTEGQTRKIARYMGGFVRRAGHDAQVIDIRRPPTGFSLNGFDATRAVETDLAGMRGPSVYGGSAHNSRDGKAVSGGRVCR